MKCNGRTKRLSVSVIDYEVPTQVFLVDIVHCILRSCSDNISIVLTFSRMCRKLDKRSHSIKLKRKYAICKWCWAQRW